MIAVTVDVGAQSRITIPRQVYSALNWLSKEKGQVECFGTLSANGCLQLVDHTNPLAERLNRLTQAAPTLSLEDSELSFVDGFRFALSCCRIDILKDRRFTVPELWRETGLIPSGDNPKVVLCVVGDFLEVWPAQKWGELMQTLAANRWQLLDETEKELERLQDLEG